MGTRCDPRQGNHRQAEEGSWAHNPKRPSRLCFASRLYMVSPLFSQILYGASDSIGFLQASAFVTTLMTQITRFQGTPDNVAEAVAARVARSRFLYEGGHRYVVLMEESVLRFRTADPEAMRGQLRHLLAVMQLAFVSLGIIPFTAQRTVWPLKAFYVHDGTMAVVETLTAEIKVTQPRELADYAKAFMRPRGDGGLRGHGPSAHPGRDRRLGVNFRNSPQLR